ncbi:cell wall mannoprotein Pir3p [[Candida] railenensis]|uniref:Cell wall mannoprotein Pir3p n=1 Tax=[Candida] railenensis TaxID=45579 RepID=A0A9P0W0G4_9ASCO|nr:cell wall mannoprotein Pir3p [[Candida] railenensis]
MAAKIAAASYDPSADDDWTQFKPECSTLAGSHVTLPFQFGFVVNPYYVNEAGEYEEPIVTPVPRSTTKYYETSRVTTITTRHGTTFTTSEINTVPKPTKAAVIHQIYDGQIQNFDEPCDDEVEEPCDDFYEEPCEDTYDEEPCDTPCEEGEEEPCEEGEEEPCEDDEDHIYKRNDEDCDEEFVSPVYTVACSTDSVLKMTLTGSILRDGENRIGSIVGSRQFQFDGPVPQYGTIYAAGWSVTSDGQLALGDSTKFYQCASGGFYNIYDTSIAEQCSPVTLDVVEIIECEGEADSYEDVY